MSESPRPWNEAERLKFLRELRILGTAPEGRYDRITRLVCRALDVPIAAISLVEDSRQWLKSVHGLSIRETPRDVAFCAHTIMSDEALVVPDASKDARFRNNPLVIGEPQIRFYAGFPLQLESDIRIGALCAIDRRPREITNEQLEIMADLRELVISELSSVALTEAIVALRTAEDRARQESDAKSRFLKNMSHEIRTPLHGIVVAADILAQEAANDAQRKYVGLIQASGRRLRGAVDQIFDFSEMESRGVTLVRDSFDPRCVIEESVAQFQSEATQKGIYVRAASDPSIDARMLGDARRVGQILCNLLQNAVSATSDGGILVSATAERGRPDGRIELHIEVRDTGIGVPPETMEALFEPFSQVAARKGGGAMTGAGLGLAICKRLVEAMKGKIGVVSAPAQGATFRFSIELDAAPAADRVTIAGARALQKDAGLAFAGRFVGRRILVAEDVRTSRMAISSLLESLGCVVDAACDGVEALQKMRDNDYDAVLMDCQMPVVDGYTATRLIRQEGRHELPIVAVTANATAEDREEASNAGISDYLSKPFVKAELIEMLNRIWK